MELKRLDDKGKRWTNLPLGITKTEGGIHVCVAASGERCALVVRNENGRGREQIFPFTEDGRTGDVWTMDLSGSHFEDLLYCLETDGKRVPDSYARSFIGRDKWGNAAALEQMPLSRLAEESFDWEQDRHPDIAYEDSFIYQLHTRGFTRHPSSQVQDRGSFAAIIEKIGYLKELGVTAVELLPPNEFSEIVVTDGKDGGPQRIGEPTGRLNYWGYTKGCYFAPKASYTSGKPAGPAAEFKALVKALHGQGLEMIVQLFFAGGENPALIRDALRFWVQEFHVDGIHLMGFADGGLFAGDPYLAGTKIFVNSWNNENGRDIPRLAECNDGFLNDMRRILKGDEDQINGLIFRTKHNPRGFGTVNYMASTNGFTMMDMVSYERKHNEANGEENRDGSDCNYTWNCGAEGPTKKKKIVKMRKKQLRNAFLLLFLSQGTPLILSGDEFGDTKGGNNNSYCQDNETSWLNWKLVNTNSDLLEFVRYAAAFRKKHPVFHRTEEPRVMDYLNCGYPDVSYHGVKAWRPEFENYRRQLGILYCGDYCKKADGGADDYFYVAYNMHWEAHEFDLPKLPKTLMWHIAFNTDEEAVNGIYKEGEELLLAGQKHFIVPERSIVVLKGLKEKDKQA